MSRNRNAELTDVRGYLGVLAFYAIPFALAVALASESHAQSAGKITRTIDLEVVEGSPFIVVPGSGDLPGMGAPRPSAMVSFLSFGGDALVEFQFKAMPIAQQLDDGSYALYVTTRASSADYVHNEFGSGRVKFNTDWNGTVNLWGVFPFFQSIDAPRVTVFVAYDPDDGRAFDPDLDAGLVIFEGTSLR